MAHEKDRLCRRHHTSLQLWQAVLGSAQPAQQPHAPLINMQLDRLLFADCLAAAADTQLASPNVARLEPASPGTACICRGAPGHST